MPRDKAERVDDNRVVTLTFTLEDETGAPITEAPPAAPYVYLHGHGQLLSAFEEALDGREVGERFSLTVPPDEAFGRRREAPERVLPRDALPSAGELVAGAQLTIDDDGASIPAWVVRSTAAHVVVSLQHPWARDGAVKMDAEVLQIREADAEELERGRAAPRREDAAAEVEPPDTTPEQEQEEE